MREIARYRQLDQAQITQTLRRLRDRISERFPGSGLGNVAGVAGIALLAIWLIHSGRERARRRSRR